MTYSYYGYVNAILSAEYQENRAVAEVEVSRFHGEDWHEVSDQLTYEVKDNRLLFYANSYFLGMNACMYRTLRENDSIEVTIHSQLYSQPWGAINVFISNLGEDEIMEDDNYLFRMGRFNKEGIYTKVNNQLEKYMQFDCTRPIGLSILREGDDILFRVKPEQGDWQQIKALKLDLADDKPLNVGFQIKLNDGAYVNWKYSNFIQINSEITSPFLKIEYSFGLKKNWKCYIDNYFINYRLTKAEELENWHVDRLDFVKYCINQRRYVEAWLNFYFLSTRSEYQKRDGFHEYLIYGYSDSKELLYVLGYNDSGILTTDVIRYQDFMDERNRCKDSDYLVEYEKDLDGVTYEFNLESVTEMIRQYLFSVNSSIYTNHMFPKLDIRYGIDVYDGIMTDGGLVALLYDRRIAHLLYEHKKLMRERLDFLKSKGIALKKELFEQCDELILHAMRLRNISRKYFLVEKTKERYDDLRKRVEDIKTMDQAFMRELLLELTEAKQKSK